MSTYSKVGGTQQTVVLPLAELPAPVMPGLELAPLGEALGHIVLELRLLRQELSGKAFEAPEPPEVRVEARVFADLEAVVKRVAESLIVQVEAPQVTVEAPKVTVEAPKVDVEAPKIGAVRAEVILQRDRWEGLRWAILLIMLGTLTAAVAALLWGRLAPGL